MKIRQKLSRQHFNHYDIVEEFLADVRLVFDNCAKYNAVSTRRSKANQGYEHVLRKIRNSEFSPVFIYLKNFFVITTIR